REFGNAHWLWMSEFVSRFSGACRSGRLPWSRGSCCRPPRAHPYPRSSKTDCPPHLYGRAAFSPDLTDEDGCVAQPAALFHGGYPCLVSIPMSLLSLPFVS